MTSQIWMTISYFRSYAVDLITCLLLRGCALRKRLQLRNSYT